MMGSAADLGCGDLGDGAADVAHAAYPILLEHNLSVVGEFVVHGRSAVQNVRPDRIKLELRHRRGIDSADPGIAEQLALRCVRDSDRVRPCGSGGYGSADEVAYQVDRGSCRLVHRICHNPGVCGHHDRTRLRGSGTGRTDCL